MRSNIAHVISEKTLEYATVEWQRAFPRHDVFMNVALKQVSQWQFALQAMSTQPH